MKLTSEELAILVLHLNLMRKAIKKGFKKTYGMFGYKAQMKIYDGILEYLSELDIEQDQKLMLSDEHHEMLVSFLEWYKDELARGMDANDKDQVNALEVLNGITEKTKLQKVV